MLTPFHESIPDWIIKEMQGKLCSRCSHFISKNDILAIGVRKTDKNKNVPYIEYSCPGCGHSVSRFFADRELDDLKELCYILLDELKSKNKNRKTEYKSDSKKPISKNEFSNFVKKLNKCKNHVDFMKSIGADVYDKMLKKHDKKNENK